LLPSPELKKNYDEIVWVYVYRDFSKNERDRAAERISLRFGVTSWPQLFLVDPATMKILRHTGRQVESFQKAVAASRVKPARTLEAHKRIVDAEARAIALEKRGGKKLARKGLDDDDIVVRTRALEILADKDPKTIVARATELLAVPSDPFRYAVCGVLKKQADSKAAPALEAIVRKPQQSLNPNVLRMRAVQALATCGNAGSVEVIAPFAQSGEYFNGLTGTSVDALAAIAKRDKKARKRVHRVLKGAYPPPAKPPPPGTDPRGQRACIALAKRIHNALKDPRPFPSVYDEDARAALMK
jgi:hypothetical protein